MMIFSHYLLHFGNYLLGWLMEVLNSIISTSFLDQKLFILTSKLRKLSAT